MPYGPTYKEKYMPYGPTHKQQIYALWAYLQRIIKYALWAYSQTINIYALWAYSQTINIYIYICLMGLLAKNKNMPYGPMCITE